jgi:hypothetical protein
MPKKASNRSKSHRVPRDKYRAEYNALVQPQPDVMCVRLAYPFVRDISCSTYNGEYLYRMNDCFDPDYTGTGGQPSYFDQWMTLYRIFRVMAVDVELDVMSNAGAVGQWARCCVSPDPGLATGMYYDNVCGWRGAQTGTYTSGGPPVKLRAHYDLPEMFGVTKSGYKASDGYAGLIGSSPSQAMGLYFVVNTSSASPTVSLSGRMIFTVRFEKPRAGVDAISRPLQIPRTLVSTPPTPSPPVDFPAVEAKPKDSPVHQGCACGGRLCEPNQLPFFPSPAPPRE